MHLYQLYLCICTDTCVYTCIHPGTQSFSVSPRHLWRVPTPSSLRSSVCFGSSGWEEAGLQHPPEELCPGHQPSGVLRCASEWESLLPLPKALEVSTLAPGMLAPAPLGEPEGREGEVCLLYHSVYWLKRTKVSPLLSFLSQEFKRWGREIVRTHRKFNCVRTSEVLHWRLKLGDFPGCCGSQRATFPWGGLNQGTFSELVETPVRTCIHFSALADTLVSVFCNNWHFYKTQIHYLVVTFSRFHHGETCGGAKVNQASNCKR